MTAILLEIKILNIETTRKVIKKLFNQELNKIVKYWRRNVSIIAE